MNAQLLSPVPMDSAESPLLEEARFASNSAVDDDRLESLMQRRLGNRIRGLRILRLDAGLVIQGRAPTYHVKQLATHAAMEFADEPILANDIEVM